MLFENVENVDGDTVTVKREDYERLKYERDEYRDICLAYTEKFDSLEAKFLRDEGGVTNE